MSVPAEAVARDAPVAGRVQRECACAHKGETCAECAAEKQRRVQPKLRLGTPGDRWEQEADRIAEQVVADRPTPISGPLPVTPLVQMQEDEDEERLTPEAEDEEELQAKAAAGSAPTPAVARAAAAVGGGGRPLSRSERAWVEPRLGRDLSPVRIHDDAAAGAAARGINARAYALRNHIAFAPGSYDAGSAEGRRLLAHELVHTIQQGRDEAPRPSRPECKVGRPASARGRGTIQRLLSPVPDGKPVCSRPPSPRSLGKDVHEEIQFKFLKGGSGRVAELNLPFTDTTACKMADRDGFEPPTSKGRPDLAIVSHGATKVTVRLGEIKPYNVTGVSAGAGVMACYEAGVARNADVCKAGERALAGSLEAPAIPFCKQLQAFGKDVELGSPILWNPGPVDVRGRPITALNFGGGLLFYACPDKLKKAQKKSAKKKAKAAKKGSATKGVKKSAKKTALGKGGKQVAKTGGKKLLKGVAKKAVPGAAWVEAAAFAIALLAGATPTFGAEGMSVEEALLQIALTGVPPDVAVSDELRELLTANPDVLAKLNAAANGEVPSDEAAQAMIDMLEANKDLLDAETLEGIAALAESSGQPRLAKTAVELRRTLEAVREGTARTGAGGEEAGPAAAEKGETTAEPGSVARAEAKAGIKLSDEFKEELKGRKPLSDLFEQVVDRSREEGFDEAAVARFRAAVAGLTDAQLQAILEQVAALPPAEEGEGQRALDVVVDQAAKLAAGEKTPRARGPGAAKSEAPPTAEAPGAGAEEAGPITLDENKLGWIRHAMAKVQERARVEIALSEETIRERVAEIIAKDRALKEGEKADLGLLPAAYAARVEEKARGKRKGAGGKQQGGPDLIGAFVAVRATDLTATILTVKIVASSGLVDREGRTYAGPSPVGTEFSIDLPPSFLNEAGTKQ